MSEQQLTNEQKIQLTLEIKKRREDEAFTALSSVADILRAAGFKVLSPNGNRVV